MRWPLQPDCCLDTGCGSVRDAPEKVEQIEAGEIDPSFVISHRLDLGEAPQAYEMFKHKQDACTKVVLSA